MPKINGNVPIGKMPYRQQSSFGGKETPWRAQSPTNTPENTVFFARVLKVNYLDQTVQYIPEKNYLGNSITFNTENQNSGIQNAKLPTRFWGETIDGRAFGENTFIQQGSRILVTYIEGDKGRPVVLGVYPTDDTNNTSELAVVNQTELDDSNYETQESAWTSRTIFPNLQFQTLSGNGDLTRTFNGDTFLRISNDPLGFLGSQFYGLSSDASNLRIDGSEITPNDPDAQALLLRHASNTSTDTHDSRFYLDNKGALHYTFYDTEKKGATFVDYSQNDGVVITRVTDSNTKEDAKAYTKMYLGDANGSFRIESHDREVNKSIALDSKGFTVDGELLVTEGSFDQLAKQFQQLVNDFAKLQDAINSIGLAFITSLPNTIEKINLQLGNLGKDIATANDNANNAVSIAQGTADKLATYMKATNELLSGINATLTTVKAETDDYSANKADYKKAVVDIKTVVPKVVTLENTVATLGKEVDAHTSTINGYGTRFTKLEDSSSAHETSIKNINEAIKTIGDKDTTQDTTLSALTDRISSLEKENTTLKASLEALTARVVALEK